VYQSQDGKGMQELFNCIFLKLIAQVNYSAKQRPLCRHRLLVLTVLINTSAQCNAGRPCERVCRSAAQQTWCGDPLCGLGIRSGRVLPRQRLREVRRSKPRDGQAAGRQRYAKHRWHPPTLRSSRTPWWRRSGSNVANLLVPGPIQERMPVSRHTRWAPSFCASSSLYGAIGNTTNRRLAKTASLNSPRSWYAWQEGRIPPW
jgi:hypothetical protein